MNQSLWHLLVLLLVAGLILEGIVLLGLLRQMGTYLVRLSPPRPGELPGEGPEAGRLVELDFLPEQEPAVLLFVSPRCSFCSDLTAKLPTFRRNYKELHLIPLVVSETDKSKREYAAALGQGARPDSESLFEEWSVPGTPYGVGVGVDGRVLMSGVINSLPQLETLADSVIAAGEADESEESPNHANGAREAVAISLES
jgi:hypothetical protein